MKITSCKLKIFSIGIPFSNILFPEVPNKWKNIPNDENQ